MFGADVSRCGKEEEMLVEVEVYPKVAVTSGDVGIFLKDKAGDSAMPIWIDQCTAMAIFRAIRGPAPKRPRTHNLLKGLLDDLNVSVTKVVIAEIRNDTFFAVIHYAQGGEERTKDSRPSDAIALAILSSAPIFVDKALWLSQTAGLNTAGADAFEALKREVSH